MKILQKTIKHFGFQALFFTFAWALFSQPGDTMVGYLLLTLCVMIGIAWERFLPFEESWNQPDKDLKSDLFFFILQPIIAPLTGTVITLFTIEFVPNFDFGIHIFLNTSIELQVIVGMILSGIIPYWIHRLAHESNGFLWRSHAIHHSPKKMYWMNAFRAHPFNTIWNTAGALIPALLLGMHSDAILIIGLLNNFVSLFNHMNIDFRIGILNKIFNMNEVHRWHHSEIPEEGNHNYSSGTFVIWDHIFKTYYFPRKRMNAKKIGLYDPINYPSKSVLKQFLYPICKCF
jgi:sterol desaturase/sphingolipid hydroxylase (fatty acid hydroxylase superfamily)